VRRRGADWAPAIEAGRRGDAAAAPALAALATDAARPAIVRATALELLAAHPKEAEKVVGRAGRDPDPLVRRAAATALAGFSPEARIGVGAALLADPVRSVRIEAARVLAVAPPGAFAPGERRRFETALAEYVQAEGVMADTPAAHQNLAQIHEQRGEAAAAEAEYRQGLVLDPGFWPASLGLARLYNANGRNDEAEAALRAGIGHAPAEGELHYSLGLLLAERGHLAAAAESLSEAARLQPEEARIRYNLALALQHLGRLDEAEKMLQAAERLSPSDVDVVRALTILYVQQVRWKQALPHARRLVELTRGDPDAQRFLRQIEHEAGREAEAG
jgi:tetratricopeptide (TPR) repeat protein